MELLEKALAVHVERSSRFGGEGENCFAGIAERWNRYLVHSGKLDEPVLTAQDVARMMAEFKLARADHRVKSGSPPVFDDYLDCVNYLAWATKLADVKAGQLD
jgi:hypothetical protein